MDPSLLFMSVREYQYDIAISELGDYSEELKLRDMTEYERSYFESVVSQVIMKLYDEKIRWELAEKAIWIDSPVDVIANFYYSYQICIGKAPTDEFQEIFQIAFQAAGEILDRFL